MVKRASTCQPCSVRVQGLPTKVSRIVTPFTLGEFMQEQMEGPIWELAEPFRCPWGRAGCSGIERLPDACLQPFDPESEPVADEEAPAVGVPVEVSAC